MSFVVLHADRTATVLSDDPVIAARDTRPLRDALALLAAGERIRDGHADAVQAATKEAARAGYADGHAQGIAASEAALATELLALARRDQDGYAERQRDVARLAIEVVRRIVGEVGSAATVAGIAERAVAAILPDTRVRVRVHPVAEDAAVRRLAGFRHASVEADDTLATTDCVLETPLGRTRAGLDVQLAQLERAWDNAAR